MSELNILKILNLSENEINEINIGQNIQFKQLSILYLNYNNIEKISCIESFLKSTSILIYLGLTGNELTYQAN